MLRPGPLAAACLTGLGLLAGGCGSDQRPGEDRTGKRVKLFFTGGEQFHPVKRDLTVSESTLEPATRKLVEGPNPAERGGGEAARTQIPAGTEVERLNVRDGQAAVGLSARFLAGVPADPKRRSRAQE